MRTNKATAWMIGLPCSVMLFFILMCCLWEYRVLVGAAMLLFFLLVVGVYVRGKITEQNIRMYIFNHHEETPLNGTGVPLILRPDMREATTQQQFNCYQTPTSYQGYQSQE